jgi:type III restriction enzyme
MIAFLTRWVGALEQRHGLPALMVHKFRLQTRVDEFLGQCAAKTARRGLQGLFAADTAAPSPLAVVPEVFAEFSASTDYRPTRPLRGRTFKKHLYPLVGEMNKPELDLAVVLDTLPEVAVWLRNMDRHPRSFRLPYPSDAGDWFYPDFLARLTDARVAVIEYKGKHLEPADEGKRQIGLAWERATQGKGLFLWIGDSGDTAHGRGIGQQVQEALKG